MPSITGSVSKQGQPLGGAYVRLVGPSEEFVAEEYTKDDGKFSFHVVDGTWTLEVRTPGNETVSKPVNISGTDAEVDLTV